MNTEPRPAQERYEITITILESDIDILGHVNNVVYLRWVQEAAVAHWRARATPEELDAWNWVVIRHEIDYKRAARLGEAVIARTWVGLATDLTFERHTEILRAADRKLLASARSLWCPVNARNGKPGRVGDEVRRRWSIPHDLVTAAGT